MFKIIDLPYAYNALEPYIDALTVEIHHDRHHQTYANNLNGLVAGHEAFFDGKSLESILSDVDAIPADIRQAVINNGGGVANHDLFWSILSPNGGGEPSGELAAKINAAFGSFEELKKALIQAGITRFGSGWSWLVVNANKELEVTATLNQDSPLSIGQVPLLTLDVWEHAYYLNYQNKRPDFLAALFNIINWDEVSRRYADAMA